MIYFTVIVKKVSHECTNVCVAIFVNRLRGRQIRGKKPFPSVQHINLIRGFVAKTHHHPKAHKTNSRIRGKKPVPSVQKINLIRGFVAKTHHHPKAHKTNSRIRGKKTLFLHNCFIDYSIRSLQLNKQNSI